MEFYYLLLLPVTTIIVWLALWLFTDRHQQLHDKLLLALLVCGGLTYYILIRSLTHGTGSYVYIVLDNLESFVGLWICPLLYLYIRVVAYDAKWHGGYLWLFLPGLLMGVAGTSLSHIVGWDKILEARLTDFSLLGPTPTTAIEKLYFWVNIDVFNYTFIVMNIVLIVLSIHELHKYHQKANHFYSNIEESSVRRLHYLLLATILLMITMFSVTYFVKYLVLYRNHTLVGISLWFTFLVWSVCYNAYRIKLTKKHFEALEITETICPDLAFGAWSAAAQQTESAEPAVPHNDVFAKKIKEWENRADKPFCTDSLTLKDVADAIGISSRVLSPYIKEHKGMHFNRWINSLRIEEAKRRLQKQPDTPIGNLAIELGFTDHAAFTNTFRQMVGCSPLKYRDSL